MEMNTDNLLARRLVNMEQSQTMALNQRAKDLQAQGHSVINLTAGEPDFYTPGYVKAAAKAAVDNNCSFYTPVEGYLKLRKAIVNKLRRENGLEYSVEQIVACNGAKHALTDAILAAVDDGDEVIIPAPYWVSYSELVKLAGGRCVVVRTSAASGFKMTAQQLDEAITERSKLLILCSPCNPTGVVYTRDELEALAAVVARRERLLVISDEIYEHINYVGGHHSIACFPQMQERTAIINGVSKAYAMTGYRLGYVAAPQWWAGACAKLQGHLTSNASSIAQMAAAAALSSDGSSTKEMVEAFRRRRDLVMEYLRRVARLRCFAPDGTFYVFPDVSGFYGEEIGGSIIRNDVDMCMFLLEKALVAVVPGSAFGDDTCVRISFAAADTAVEEGMRRIIEALMR